jgi:hypothetical protein
VSAQDSHRGIHVTSRAPWTIPGVERKSPDERHITLGFKISGDGKCTAQKKAMKAKAILYGEAIKSSTILIGESGTTYNSLYMLIFGYGTPAMTVTRKEYEDIQWPAVNAMTAKNGH